MRHQLANDLLHLEIDSRGAELKSVRSRDGEREYLWQGDPAYWGRTSPVLFPIVGRLTGNSCRVNGKHFRIPLHGFAQDCEFSLRHQDAQTLVFSLSANELSRISYPFDFELTIAYTLLDDRVQVSWQVHNQGSGRMPFSIGAHPGFSTRLYPDDRFEDYNIHFNRHQQHHLWPVTPDGRLVTRPVPFLEPLQAFALDYRYFAVDALVFPDHQLSSITLKHNWHGHGVTLECPGFPVVALWTANDRGQEAPFLCIEPWFGYGDTEDGPFELQEKPGIQMLEAGGVFNAAYAMRFF